jgi:hypothetical protein
MPLADDEAKYKDTKLVEISIIKATCLFGE